MVSLFSYSYIIFVNAFSKYPRFYFVYISFGKGQKKNMNISYIDAMYKDYIKSRTDEELMSLIDYIIKILERRGKVIVGKIVYGTEN